MAYIYARNIVVIFPGGRANYLLGFSAKIPELDLSIITDPSVKIIKRVFNRRSFNKSIIFRKFWK